MKKEYQKPILEIKAYAQFENVFTDGCNSNKGSVGCEYSSGYFPNKGSSYNANTTLKS